MRNKMIWIVAAIVVLFGALFFAVQAKNKQAVDNSGNPYGKEKLHQATIDQLDDPNYQNQITPDKLAEELENQEDITVYFYDPLCVHCLNTTPVLVKVAEKHDIDIKKMNLREFEKPWQTYGIEGTPTLIHFANGEEVGRIDGERSEVQFESFFDQFIFTK